MRVMYIHAGKRINKDLKAEEYHVDLFRNKLRLRFEVPSHRNAMQNLFMDSSSSLDAIEKLPRGQILGIALFNETYWFDQNMHMSDPWKLGPFCYGILDVFRFEKGVNACGQLGIWTPKQEAQNQIAQQISVQNKINEWKQKYGDQLYIGKETGNGVPSAITILQPFVEGILRGIKRVENRKRPFFPLHTNNKFYKHPIAPKQTQCRFCPTDGGKCKYWAHVNGDDKNKRMVRNHNKKKKHKNNKLKSPPELSPMSNNKYHSETAEDYTSDENVGYKIEYNTRGHKRKVDQFINGNNNNNNHNMKENSSKSHKKNRKRKRSQIIMNGHGDSHSTHHSESPPQKKHKKSKRKKKKKSKRKKKKREEREEIDVDSKWSNIETDLRFHEDGSKPLRMCWHNTIMKPIANPESSPKKCDLCAKEITWDHYYKCKCNNMTSHYCYWHTRPITINAAKSWKNINQYLKQYNKSERLQLIQSLKTPLSMTPTESMKKKKYKNKYKNIKSNNVGVDGYKKKMSKDEMTSDTDSDSGSDSELDNGHRVPVITNGNIDNNNNGLIPHIKFDPSKMKMQPLQLLNNNGIQTRPQIQPKIQLDIPNNNNNNRFNIVPLPFKLNFDANAIQNSINQIQNKNNTSNAPVNNNNNNNNNNQLDFSSFPTVTPTIPSNGSHQPCMLFNNGSMPINNISKTNTIPSTQPSITTAMLSLSEILNQNINTNNNNNNNNTNSNNKVTPVPSPFAPSPSPTINNNNNNKNNVSSISNVYALQSLLNSNNKKNTNTSNSTPTPFVNLSTNPNPFGPTSNTNTNINTNTKTHTNNRQNGNKHTNIDNNNNNNNTSQNSTENTTTNTSNTSTSTTNNAPPKQTTQPTSTQYTSTKTLPPYYGPVIAPSYQTMQTTHPVTPVQLQQYNTLTPIQNIQNINGQMVYMHVPGGQPNMAYYQNGVVPFYTQYQQYSQPQNKTNSIPVPVQQT